MREVRPQLSARDTPCQATSQTWLADDEGVQSILPQLLIVRDDLVPLTKSQEIRSSLPRNVHLLRSKKAWASTAALLLLVRLLKEVLRPLRSSCDFVLSADTYRAHLAKPS